MSLESYQELNTNNYSSNSGSEDLSTSKAIGKVFLYMGVALLVTALVAVGVGALFAGWLTNWTFDYSVFRNIGTAFEASRTPWIVYFASVIVSFIGMLICTVALGRAAATGRHSAWPAFIVYSIFMGITLSIILIAGIDFVTIGEAFGISAGAFAIMGFIGYKSKRNLNILGMVAWTALIMVLISGLIFGLIFAFNRAAFNVFNIVYTAIVLVIFLILTAVDMYNVKRIVEKGADSKNLCLFCAFTLYTDFINIFIRVLLLLAKLKSR